MRSIFLHFKSFLFLLVITFILLGSQLTYAKYDDIKHTGTWANKDEDGDGILDEYDDYPFDPKRSVYPLIIEKEFNNNLGEATPIDMAVPFRVSGVLDQKLDTDLFRFKANQNDTITVVLKTKSAKFEPNITIFRKDGDSLQPIEPNYKPIVLLKKATFFHIRKTGTYYLAINDNNRRSSPDFKYLAFAFMDADIDALDDLIEPAFGFTPYEIDHDKDSISDSNEFYVFDENDLFIHDVDNDGIPNWLDSDSDADKIVDSIEQLYDHDKDGKASFIDDDSDNDGSLDAYEAETASQFYSDTDNDGLFDYVDTDDDGDLLLDINDSEPKQALRIAMPSESNYLELYYISYLYEGETYNDIHIQENYHTLIGEGIKMQGYIVLDMGSNNPPINLPISMAPDEKPKFFLPRNVKNIMFSTDGYRSNLLPVSYRFNRISLLEPLPEKFYKPGNTVTLTGKNFWSDLKVFVGSKVVSPKIETESKLTFTLPETLRSVEVIKLRTSYGYSNTQRIKVKKD